MNLCDVLGGWRQWQGWEWRESSNVKSLTCVCCLTVVNRSTVRWYWGGCSKLLADIMDILAECF